MILSQIEIDAAAVKVVCDLLADGVSFHRVEMVLNGQPGLDTYTLPELRAIQDRVCLLFRTCAEAITPEVVA